MKQELKSLEPALKRAGIIVGIQRMSKNAAKEILAYLHKEAEDLCLKVKENVNLLKQKTVKIDNVKTVNPQNYCATTQPIFTRAIMERLLRSFFSKEYRMSENAIVEMIKILDHRIMKVLESSNIIMQHAQRRTLYETDVQIAIKLCAN